MSCFSLEIDRYGIYELIRIGQQNFISLYFPFCAQTPAVFFRNDASNW